MIPDGASRHEPITAIAGSKEDVVKLHLVPRLPDTSLRAATNAYFRGKRSGARLDAAQSQPYMVPRRRVELRLPSYQGGVLAAERTGHGGERRS